MKKLLALGLFLLGISAISLPVAAHGRHHHHVKKYGNACCYNGCYTGCRTACAPRKCCYRTCCPRYTHKYYRCGDCYRGCNSCYRGYSWW